MSRPILAPCLRVHVHRGREDHAGHADCSLCGQEGSASHYADLRCYDASEPGLSGPGKYVYGAVLCAACAADVVRHPEREAALTTKLLQALEGLGQ